MKKITSHQAFGWLKQNAMSLPIYSEGFDGAAVEIMGESPYLNSKSTGISFALNADQSVRTVFLYAEGIEEFSAYQGALPAGLSFSDSRADVMAVLGDAVMSVSPGGIGLMAIDFSFDRYEAEDYYLRIEYMPGDNGIRLVTIGLCS